MKNQLIQTIAAAALILGSLSGAHGADLDKAQIAAVLKGYERVLNASDVDGVVKLYTKDGVFMAQHNPSAVGIKQVEAAYTAVFQAIDLNVEFDIVEIEVISDYWAFARTNSPGRLRSTPLATKSLKVTRSCSFCGRLTVVGRLLGTVFLRPTHHDHESRCHS